MTLLICISIFGVLLSLGVVSVAYARIRFGENLYDGKKLILGGFLNESEKKIIRKTLHGQLVREAFRQTKHKVKNVVIVPAENDLANTLVGTNLFLAPRVTSFLVTGILLGFEKYRDLIFVLNMNTTLGEKFNFKN